MSRKCLDLWSLLAAPQTFDPEDLGRTGEDVIARLLKSRSPRSDPPLRFIHKNATAAVVDLIASSQALPPQFRIAVVDAMLRQPQRFVELTRSDSDHRRVGMAGVYAGDDQTYLVSAVGELGQVGPATGFTSISLQAVDVPDDVDAISAAILAEEMESLAVDATNAETTFSWSAGRASRAVWCGLPWDTSRGRKQVAAVGTAAGLALTLSDPDRSDRLALSSSPELVVLLSHFASANEDALARDFKASGGELITVDSSTPDGAMTDARVGIHDLVGRQHAIAMRAEPPTRPTRPAPRPIADTRHASEQGRLRGFTQEDINEALGNRYTRPARAAVGGTATPGNPLLIGTQAGSPGSPDHKDVLLCVTVSGRRLHLVVTRTDGTEPMSVVTGWDPDVPENEGIWRSDALRPTASGAFELPPTGWIVP